MRVLSAFFFGTVDFLFPEMQEGELPETLARSLEILREKGITAKSLPFGLRIFLKDKKRVKAILNAEKIVFEEKDNPSLPRFIYHYRKRYGVFAAAVLFAAMQLSMSDLILNVEVVGAVRYPTSVLKAEAVDSGLTVGSLWRDLDIGQIEAKILSSSERIGWVSINRRGMTAYVEISELDDAAEKEKELPSPCNIVADSDCVITEIGVRTGKACVKAGDTVKSGDVLISGIGPGRSMLVADGEVFGILSGECTVFVPRSETCRLPEKTEILRRGVSVFNFDINFYKKYRNSQESCDIIEKREEVLLPNGKSLPLAGLTTEAVSFRETVVNRSEAEMIAVAKSRMGAMLLAAVSEGDLLSETTEALFSEEGYRITVRFTYTAPIGKTVPILIE